MILSLSVDRHNDAADHDPVVARVRARRAVGKRDPIVCRVRIVAGRHPHRLRRFQFVVVKVRVPEDGVRVTSVPACPETVTVTLAVGWVLRTTV